MNIIWGTFRLSVLVGLAALAYNTHEASQLAARAAHWDWEMWNTMRCGRTLMQTHDLTQHRNAYGNFDLGKLGCSTRTFWTNVSEIEDAWKKPDPYQDTWNRVWWYKLTDGTLAAFGLFVLANLLGFAFLGLRRAFRWVLAGYKGH